MTKQTILQNCHRLQKFLEQPEINLPISDDSLTLISLLHWYSIILDINGCWNKGTSILFIKDKEEYEEIKYYAKLNFAESFKERGNAIIPDNIKELFPKIVSHPRISFEYNGYYWEVENNFFINTK